MYYKSILPEDKSWIDYLQQRISQFNNQSFEDALRYKRFSIEDIENLNDELATYICRVNREYTRLAKKADVFVNTYAFDGTDKYKDGKLLASKLSSSLCGTKKIFKKFCPRAHKENFYHSIGNKPVSIYKYSLITLDSYQLSMFQMEGYPECVTELFNLMSEFFFYILKMLQLCKDVLKKVEENRSDPELMKYMLEKLRYDILAELDSSNMLIPLTSPCFSPEKNMAIALRMQYPNDSAFAPHGYHNVPNEDMKYMFIYEEQNRLQSSNCSSTEIHLFGDEEMVPKYRSIIMNMGLLVDPGYTGKKMPAKVIYYFFRFINVNTRDYRKAYDYLCEKYGEVDNQKYDLPNVEAVKSARRTLGNEDNDEYKEFASRIKMFLLNGETKELRQIC